jgi:hypothetical protein
MVKLLKQGRNSSKASKHVETEQPISRVNNVSYIRDREWVKSNGVESGKNKVRGRIKSETDENRNLRTI